MKKITLTEALKGQFEELSTENRLQRERNRELAGKLNKAEKPKKWAANAILIIVGLPFMVGICMCCISFIVAAVRGELEQPSIDVIIGGVLISCAVFKGIVWLLDWALNNAD